MWNRWYVDRMRGIWWIWKLIVLFFPVPCEVTGSNPEFGDYSAVARGWGCAHKGFCNLAWCCMYDAHTMVPTPIAHSKQYWPTVLRLGRSLLGLVGQAPPPKRGGKSPIRHDGSVAAAAGGARWCLGSLLGFFVVSITRAGACVAGGPVVSCTGTFQNALGRSRTS